MLNEPRAGAGGHEYVFRASGFDRRRVVGTDSGIGQEILAGTDRHHRRQRAVLRCRAFEVHEEVADRDARGAAHRMNYVAGHAGRQARRVSGAARTRTSHFAFGAEFSRQYLWR